MRGLRVILTLWLAYTAFVVYGSLVPLDFHPQPLNQAWQAFLHIPYLQLGLDSRADWVANGVLYLPLGYLSATLLFRAGGRAWRLAAIVLAGLFCFGLALGVEFAQLFFPPRTVSLNDLIAEFIGSALGVVLAPFLLPWLKQAQARWRLGGAQLHRHALQAYAVAYGFLCLFPFDFLISAAEWREKIDSPSWGWLLAADAPRPALVMLQLGVEVVMAVPIGFLVGRRSRTGLGWGLLTGLAIELGQLCIASGISQGLSVLTRMLGVMVGVALWRRRERVGIERLATSIRRSGPWLAPLYLAALATANGWFQLPWHGLAGAIEQWPSVRLMPFYYHYFTTEARALFSLGNVALMYAPLALWAWAGGWRSRRLLLLALALSCFIEASKLFLDGTHPDPTNVLIALVSVWIVRRALTMLLSPPPARTRSPESASMPLDAELDAGLVAPRPPVAPPHAPARVLGLLVFASALLWAALFPAFAPLLCLLLLVCAGVVWVRPVLALAIIPAALPVLDLAPWSGRFYWDEFDLLMLCCLSVGFYRTRLKLRSHLRWDGLGAGFLLLALSLGLSTVLGLLPWQPVDADSFVTYTSHFNALRIAKGALWALGFVLLFCRLAEAGEARARMFGRGMQLGLAMTLLFLLWERAAFVGLFNFADDYRVTGPVSAMHKGGAYIECYLAVASAFALQSLLQARAWPARLTASALLLLATYGVMVTFSRNGYAALAVVVAVMVLARLLARPLKPRRVALVAGVLVLMGAVAAPIVAGPYARERLARSGSDLTLRQEHWRDALAIRRPGWITPLLGMGIGRFPERHYWYSHEPRAGAYGIEQEAGNHFLRLGAGTTVYMEQFVDLEPGRDYTLSARLRSSQTGASLSVMLCEKWMLTSRQCETAVLAAGPQPGVWQRVETTLKAGTLGEQPWYARRPLKLALLTPAKGASVDIDAVHLESWPIADALRNGDFEAGLDHWFFTTDVDPPWHIHSLPLGVLFDQGWFGVLAWTLVVGLALYKGARRIRRGSMPALAATAAVLGFLVSGSLNTLIDAPRFLWLLLVLLWLCRADDGRPPASAAVRGRPAG
jgi:VanZ family protein